MIRPGCYTLFCCWNTKYFNSRKEYFYSLRLSPLSYAPLFINHLYTYTMMIQLVVIIYLHILYRFSKDITLYCQVRPVLVYAWTLLVTSFTNSIYIYIEDWLTTCGLHINCRLLIRIISSRQLICQWDFWLSAMW